MTPNNDQRKAANSVFVQSINWLATMAAVIITFLLTPKAYAWTIDWIVDYASQNYGYGFEDLISFVWGLCLALTIFALSRATVSTALVLGGLTLASRLF